MSFLENPQGETPKFIEFILRICCKQTAPKNAEAPADLWELQKSAGTTLYMLSTSLPALQDVLWNVLLNCFINHQYEDACVVMLRCLTYIASKNAHNASRSEETLVRCLALLADPLPDLRGTSVLKFLGYVKLSRDAAQTCVLENKLVQLQNYLEQSFENLNRDEWQGLVLDFLALIVENSAVARYSQVLLEKMELQLRHYSVVR